MPTSKLSRRGLVATRPRERTIAAGTSNVRRQSASKRPYRSVASHPSTRRTSAAVTWIPETDPAIVRRHPGSQRRRGRALARALPLRLDHECVVPDVRRFVVEKGRRHRQSGGSPGVVDYLAIFHAPARQASPVSRAASARARTRPRRPCDPLESSMFATQEKFANSDEKSMVGKGSEGSTPAHVSGHPRSSRQGPPSSSRRSLSAPAVFCTGT
jgi:hypothetical protein